MSCNRHSVICRCSRHIVLALLLLGGATFCQTSLVAQTPPATSTSTLTWNFPQEGGSNREFVVQFEDLKLRTAE